MGALIRDARLMGAFAGGEKKDWAGQAREGEKQAPFSEGPSTPSGP